MNNLPYPLVIMTCARPELYLRTTLESLAPDQPVAFVVGSPDADYLSPFLTGRPVQAAVPTPTEYAPVANLGPHARAIWNYWRCLEHGVGQPYLLILEDDVRCARGWEARLTATVEEIAARCADFVLSLYFPYAKWNVSGARYVSYPKQNFYGTQGVLFAGRALPGFAAHLYHRGVCERAMPYDLLLKEYVMQHDVPLFASVPSLVQHIGVVTTGLGRFHTTPWFVEDVADWQD